MFDWLIQLIAKVYINLLLIVKPALLFHKINNLSWYRQMLQQWLQENHFKPQSSLLEIGCATGVMSEYLAASGFTVTAVDKSNAMINSAIKNNRDTTVDYKVADVFNLPFKQKKFDIVVCASLLNVIPNPQKALAEIKRVCMPGATISFLVPQDGFNSDQFDRLVKSLRLSGFSLAALSKWHQLAPKMQKQNVSIMLKNIELLPTVTQDYLNGMVFSITARYSS